MSDDVKPEVEEKTINVVTTDKGANSNGIIEAGAKLTIPVEAFSAKWMKPADVGSASRIKAAAKAKA